MPEGEVDERSADENLQVLAEVAAEPADQMIEAALSAAREMLGLDMALVSELGSGGQTLRYVEGDAASFSLEAGTVTPLSGGYCERMIKGTLPNVIHDVRQHDMARDIPATFGADVGCYVGVPLRFSDGALFGSFACLGHEPASSLGERDVSFMLVLARMVSGQIERQRAEAKVRRLGIEAGAAEALMSALEARERYTGEHSKAVVRLAVALAERLGLDEDERSEVAQVALLHDIGKVAIPEAILTKPGPLDSEEWGHMREHPAIGADILLRTKSLAHLAPVVRAEHEHWDGSGYPDGRTGGEIPLGARICLLCDAFHAMTSARSYRDAMSPGAAREEIRRRLGSQFCPSTGRELLAMLDQRPYEALTEI